MPRKRYVGHPGQMEVMSEAGFYENPSDDIVISRLDEEGSPFNGLIGAPSYPIVGASVQAFGFRRRGDIDADEWLETIREDATESEKIAIAAGEIGGAAEYDTVGEDNTTEYTQADALVTLGQTDVWINVRVKINMDGMFGGTNEVEFHIGFEDPSDPTRNVIFTISLDDSIYAQQYVDFEQTNEERRSISSIVASEINSIFDGEYHDISIHFSPEGGSMTTGETGQVESIAYFYIDGVLGGTEWGISPDDLASNPVMRDSDPEPVALNFGTTNLTGFTVTTTISSIIIIQDLPFHQ